MMGSRGIGYCQACGGTLLPNARSGAGRGSCHCPRGPGYIVGRMFYGEVQKVEYAVSWPGCRDIDVTPPTLDRAVQVLNELRIEHNKTHQEGG